MNWRSTWDQKNKENKKEQERLTENKNKFDLLKDDMPDVGLVTERGGATWNNKENERDVD